MNRKSIATLLTVAVLSVSLASPVFAQEQQSSGNGGFFGMFAQFVSRIFAQGQQTQGNGNHPLPPQGNPNVSGVPNGAPSGMPAGGPQMGGDRLQGLVTAGKITQAQADQITTEVNKIKSEVQSWSQSTGIDASYIYGALRGLGMSAGIGGGQGGPNGQFGQNGQNGYQGSGTPRFQGGPVHGGMPNGGFNSNTPGTQQP